jgi:hypothetical protein
LKGPLISLLVVLAFQITVTKTYNVTNLFEDIKALYKIAGVRTTCILQQPKASDWLVK